MLNDQNKNYNITWCASKCIWNLYAYKSVLWKTITIKISKQVHVEKYRRQLYNKWESMKGSKSKVCYFTQIDKALILAKIAVRYVYTHSLNIVNI